MSFFITHLSGHEEREPDLARLGDLLDELGAADSEHPDVSLTHESEWSLGVYRSGTIVIENLEQDEPRHAKNMGRAEILELMELLSEGRWEEVLEAQQWETGYP